MKHHQYERRATKHGKTKDHSQFSCTYNMNRLAIKIKEARLKAKMSEKDLAQAIGQNINYILQIESGKKIINEKIADDILKALGTEMDSFQDTAGYTKEKEQTAIKPVVKPIEKKKEEVISPNDSWSGALSGVIKKYSIVDEISGKEVGSKELSILGKKVEGIHFEKVMFVQVSESELPKYRLMKKDVVTVHLVSEMTGSGIYYFEYGGKKMIRHLHKIQNHLIAFSKNGSDAECDVPTKDIKIIGRVVKIEILL